MAGTTKRLGNLLADTRSRTILLFTVFLLLVAIVAGFFGMRNRTRAVPSKVEISAVPGGIQAIPGGMTPTQQRIRLQKKQDVEKVSTAEKRGTSALPTILELKKLGRGQTLAGAEGGVGFEALQRMQREGGVEKPLWFDDVLKNNCNDDSLQKAIKAGANAKDLHDAGCCAAKLKANGFTAKQLRAAGYSADELKGACYPADAIAAASGLPAGVTVDDIKKAGCVVDELRKERLKGVSAKQIKDIAGCDAAALSAAGFSNEQLQTAGIKLAPPPTPPAPVVTAPGDLSGQQLDQVLQRQAAQMSQQQVQQKITQAQSRMSGDAKTFLAGWKTPNQVFVLGQGTDKPAGVVAGATGEAGIAGQAGVVGEQGAAVIKAGDIMFATLDTSINTDEPGPVLATIVQGKYKGAKLLGGVQPLGQHAQKVVLDFRTMRINGIDKTISINAVAIDPNTARTAVSSHTDNHYLLRYGSLFASSFLEGLGQVIQSSGSKIVIGASGTTTIDNAELDTTEKLIAPFAKVGEAWGQAIAPTFNRPPTIRVYSGVGLGILFTQDVTI